MISYYISTVSALLAVCFLAVTASSSKGIENNEKKCFVAAVAASISAIGLKLSGMTKPYKVFGFLNVLGLFNGTWDGTLMFVMGGGLFVSAASYHWVKHYNFFRNDAALSCPIFQDDKGGFNIPQKTIVDKRLILGASLFGIGWGLGGVCPGPALFNVASGYPPILYYWWPANLIGAFIGHVF